jgi:hypothetical protein
VQLLGFFEAFEREAARGLAVGGDFSQASRQGSGKFAPALFVEPSSQMQCLEPCDFLFLLQRQEQRRFDCVVLGSQFAEPVFHDLRIAKIAHGSENLACAPAHLVPSRVRVYL